MADVQDNYRKQEEDEDEEEEDADDTGYKSVKDAVLFAIDVSPSMLRVLPTDSKKGGANSATSAALKCAYALMQQRIISNPRDMMGILLFGTKETKFQEEEEHGKGSLQYPNCYLLADLDIPAAADVKRLRSLIEDEESAAQLLVPSEQPVAMANVLFCANQIFTTKAPNFSSRRLFLVTDNDNPHAEQKDLKSSAVVRAKDLYDLGVIIELFPISNPNHDFDRTKFYDDIVYRMDVTDPEAPLPMRKPDEPLQPKDGLTLLNSLLSSINSKAMPRRTLIANLPLEFSPSFKITVKAYVIFKRQVPTRSCYIWLDGETPQIAVGSTTQMADDTARTVEKVEIRKAFKFGGETVTFTPEELAAVKNFGDPVIRILGFKPLSALPLWANLKVATFIYPSEDEYIGSTRTFSALQQTLLRHQKMGLVWYIARKNAAPVLAALVPGAEELNDNGEQLMPPGLWLIPVPFADDIRQNPEINHLVRAPDPLVDKMRVIMEQLQLPGGMYDPQKYPNPALQWHYRILQALALEEELPEQPEDKTIPRYRPIDKRAGPYIRDWKVELETQFREWQLSSRSGPVKRGPDASSASAAKKSKTAGDAMDVDSIDDSDMRKHFDKNTVGKLTVAVLREWLGAKGQSIVGRKADLVERVEAFFENK